MMTNVELNAHIADGTINDVIRVAEARQVKTLSRIADSICADGHRRLVLVTGASAAGKTTTAKRICTQLLVNDRPAALHLSTDDYFVGDELNPRDENGELDYEHVECVDIPRLTADINALLAAKVSDCEGKGVKVTLQIESAWSDLPIESWAMCRVLGNLIDNALDALRAVPEGELTIRLSESLHGYDFSVTNNGPMIPPNVAEKIFQRGFSTKGEGRGMGLSIVREIIDGAGGRLSVSSDERETTFSGTLPRPAPAVRGAGATPE